MDIRDRIIQIIEFKGISKNAFEKAIGVSKSYIANTKSISADVAASTCLVYSDISPIWLLTGEGSMIKTDSSHTDHAKESVVIDMAQDSSSIYERMIEKKDKRIEELALMVGNLQKEVEMLKQDKKIAQEADDASNAVEGLRLTGTDDQ